MNDALKSVAILGVFALLVANIALTLSKQSIQRDWPTYRCTPLIMPLAGSLSPDGMSTKDNFSYCIQDIMRGFAPLFTAPLQHVQAMTLTLVNNSTTTQEATMKEQQKTNKSTGQNFGNVFNVLLGVVVEFRVLLTRLTDSQAKLSGVMATITYMTTAVMYTFQSMWDGIPGGMIRAFGGLNR
jgi:hypothetical protein